MTVGEAPTQEAFSIQKDLLCQKAPLFGKMFNSGFQEGISQTSLLPDDNIATFLLFVTWLYQNFIGSSNNPLIEIANATNLIHLYAFGENTVSPD